MKKILLLSLLCITALKAAKLKNGDDAPQEKIDQVYSQLKTLRQQNMLLYYWFWRTCKLCSTMPSECVVKDIDYEYIKKLSPEEIQQLTEAGLVKDGKIDKDTQNITISAYTGTADPKIVGIQDPQVKKLK